MSDSETTASESASAAASTDSSSTTAPTPENPEINITGPAVNPETAESTDAVGEAATAETAAAIKPPDIATTIAPGYGSALASVIPNAGVIEGEPQAHTPITQGFFSHVVSGLVDKIDALLEKVPGFAAVQANPGVQKAEGDAKATIEQLAAAELANALSFLTKAKDIFEGQEGVVITEAEADVRDIALSAIPEGLRGIAGTALAAAISGNGTAQAQNVLLAIQHGIFALGARVAHVAGA